MPIDYSEDNTEQAAHPWEESRFWTEAQRRLVWAKLRALSVVKGVPVASLLWDYVELLLPRIDGDMRDAIAALEFEPEWEDYPSPQTTHDHTSDSNVEFDR